MKPYYAEHITEGILLNANESAYPPPAALATHMKEWTEKMLTARYPDTDSRKLTQAIASAYGVEENNVTCGVGSDELIDCILSSTLEMENKVLAPHPSFSMYAQFTLLNNGQFIPIPLKPDFTYDVEAILVGIKTYKPKVIFLCNPNNPTGSLLKVEEIKRILEEAEGIVVVDEAYAEFYGCTESMVSFINDYKNLIILKTFSKAYALAGARVGYAVASSELIDLINTVKAPYNLSIFSQEVATWAISNKALYQANIDKIIEERTIFSEGLQALGIKVYPSYANFIWTELSDKAYRCLEENKIYIRKINYQNQNYYRITIGTPEENEALLKVLGTVL